MADTVNLLSSDGKSFAVLAKVASMSKTLRDLMEDAAGADNIPLPTIDAKILEKVVAYCMQHVDDPAPAAPVADDKKLELSDKPIEISTWDKEFTSGMDQETIFQLILAANYLDVRSLLDLCCRTVALQVLGKTPDEIYAMFKVDQKLTPEEEELVRKENPWLEDQ